MRTSAAVQDKPKRRYAARGTRTGKIHGIYMDDPVWEKLQERCRVMQISVSEHLTRLALSDLNHGQR